MAKTLTPPQPQREREKSVVRGRISKQPLDTKERGATQTRSRCPEVGLGILNPSFRAITKEWNQEFLNRPLDTQKKNERSRCPEVGLGILDFIIRRSVEQREACKFHWFSLCFKHIEKFDAISKHRPLTGQGLEAHFENSPKNFYVFLAWFYWCFVNLEQRHRRRIAQNDKRVSSQTYLMFRKDR